MGRGGRRRLESGDHDCDRVGEEDVCEEKEKKIVEGMHQGSLEKRKVKLKYLLRYLRDDMNQKTVPQIDSVVASSISYLPNLSTCS